MQVVRDLRRAPDSQVAVGVGARHRAVRLDGHVRRPSVAIRLARHRRGRSQRLVDRAKLELDVFCDVADFRSFVDLDLRVGQRVLGRQHCRQHLVVDLDEVQGLLCGPLVERRHASHLVADESGVIGRERLLVLRPGDDAVPGRQLGADQRRHHAGIGLGLGDVDAADARVGVRRAEDLRVQHARQRDVVGIDARPVGLGDAVDLGQPLPHAAAHGTISFTGCATESLGGARKASALRTCRGARAPRA